MQEYILLNIETELSSLFEDTLDNKILKELAFSAKIKSVNLKYLNVVVPVENQNEEIPSEFKDILSLNNYKLLDSELTSVYNTFKVFPNFSKLKLTVTRKINSEKMNVFYTDGSFSKNGTDAGYAVCQILRQGQSIFEPFTKEQSEYEMHSGKIENGTNNIGELTAISEAVKINGSLPFQVIISDSIYGIKSFREYIHVWKTNGFKTYSKKPIKNKELIESTYNNILSNPEKIYLFKWTKGHDDNELNELCDLFAKKEINLKK